MEGDTNDVNADVYDIVYAPFWPPEKTRGEVAMMTSLLPPGGSVLDLGCGTGRHLVPLARRGFRVTGVDRSEGMLAVAKHKLRSDRLAAALYQGDITAVELGAHHDLAICMWNGFAELSSAEDAVKVLKRVHASLRTGGWILIQQSNPETFDWDPTYDYTVEAGDGTYRVSWRVISSEGLMTVSEEHVTIEPHTGEREERTTRLTQRWHTRSEYEMMLNEVSFTGVEFLRADGSPFQEGDQEFIVKAKR